MFPTNLSVPAKKANEIRPGKQIMKLMISKKKRLYLLTKRLYEAKLRKFQVLKRFHSENVTLFRNRKQL